MGFFSARTLFSLRRHNFIAAHIEALRKLKVVRGGKDAFYFTAENAILELKKTSSAGPSTGSGVTYRGAWLSSEDYAENDLVFITPDTGVRELYIAASASGPSNGGAVTPNFPPDTSAWSCLARTTIDIPLWSSSVNYSAGDLVYNSADESERWLYRCLASNGPGVAAGVKEPAYPEDSYWRVLSAAPHRKMAFVSNEANHIVCSWGGNNYNIAKPYKLRNAITSATIDGQSWTYDTFSTANQTRRAVHATLGNETQIITPRYLSGDEIWAAPAKSVLTGVHWIDTNRDGRMWAKKYGT